MSIAQSKSKSIPSVDTISGLPPFPGVVPLSTSAPVVSWGAGRVVSDGDNPASALGGAGVPAGAGGAVTLGLSYSTYLTAPSPDARLAPNYRVTAYNGAGLFDFKPIRLGRQARAQVGGGARGHITEFTGAARARLLRQFNKLKREHVSSAYFLTLTYPADFPSARETKRHLDILLKRLARKFPGCAGIWKLEPQRRGAPHYHICLLGAAYRGRFRQWVRSMRSWLSRAWYDIVSSGDERHLRAGTQFDAVRSHRHALAYISKYLDKAKYTLADSQPGRFWGVFGPIEEYQGQEFVFVLSGRQALDFFRVLDKLRLVAARRKTDPDRRRRAVRYARRRRADYRSRWYIADVGQLVRYISGSPPLGITENSRPHSNAGLHPLRSCSSERGGSPGQPS